MLVTHQLPGRTVVIDGKERLYFSGTSYLGISKNLGFQQLLQEGMSRYGTNYGSSRTSNLQLAVYEAAEQQLALMANAATALTFSSGYMAGQAAIQTLDYRQPVLYAPGTHPAVWQNPQHVRQTASVGTNYHSWALHISAQVAALNSRQGAIIANALDPLLAEKYAFEWVGQLPEDKQITLLLDDSHGFGITGREGEGIYREVYAQLKPNVKLLVVSSLGKAYGIPGGVVFGDPDLIAPLKKSPFFTAGSPVPPAYLYAFVQAQSIYEEARLQLKTNVNYFQQQLPHIPDTSFHYFDHYPVFYTPDNALAKAIEDQCIISSFPYPNPDSQPITRIVINSLHTTDDIDGLCELLVQHIE